MKRSPVATASTLIVGHLLVTMGTVGAACAVILAVTSPASQFPWNVAGGRGTQGDPYHIETCAQLQNIERAPQMHYALMRDVDCAETNEWNQGAGFFPIGYYQYGFSGTLDGQGHTIRHLYINRPTTDYVGLFGKLDVGATVRNLTVQGTVTGRDYAGLLAGWMLGGSVDSVKAEGSVTGNRGVGGIAGVSQGTIQGSRAQIAVSGREWVGGIAGWNYTTASVTTAVSKGTVSGTRDVGGIAGVSHGAAVRGCTADVTVSGAEPTGGIVGRLVGNGSIASTVEDCTFTGTVNGHAHGPIIGSRKEQQE